MTMGVNESGQSVIEFLLFLPILLGITFLMLKVSQSIQVSIVNQKFVRAHLISSLHKSAFYPSLVAGERPLSSNQHIMGMSATTLQENDPAPRVTFLTVLPRIFNRSAASNASQRKVNIRTSLTICTPNYFSSAQGQGLSSGIEQAGHYCQGTMHE